MEKRSVILFLRSSDEEASTSGPGVRFQPKGTTMCRLLQHSAFSIAFVVVRIFILDAAAAPAHGHEILQDQLLQTDGMARSAAA